MAYTRSNEIGLLLAKQQHKPICVSDHGGPASTLGMNLGFLELADRITAYSDFGASFFGPRMKTPIEVIKGASMPRPSPGAASGLRVTGSSMSAGCCRTRGSTP